MTEHRKSPVCRVTVSGSFAKHWKEVQGVVQKFLNLGALVLSPSDGPPVREEDGFVYLRDDVGSADSIEQRHLGAIQQSDLLYIVNPNGYLGNSVAMEIGYALAWRIPVWSLTPFNGLPHRLLIQSGSVSQALETVRGLMGDLEMPHDGRLDDLQEYVRRMARARGFEDETPPEILILLMEEIGELAKAMRVRMRLAMATSDTSGKSVSLEQADCFIYLLHLANQTGVKLFSAFREKERINASKEWRKP